MRRFDCNREERGGNSRVSRGPRPLGGSPHPSRPALLSSQAGSKASRGVAAGQLTWAIPAPMSPPPMTVTCLTMIFFAEAEAVDEEDTERTNCLVTKAMVQR